MKQGEIWQVKLDPTIGAEMKKIIVILVLLQIRILYAQNIASNDMIESISTNSTLAHKNDIYNIRNLLENNGKSWAEGEDDFGKDVTITVKFKKVVKINTIYIQNGYGLGGRDYFYANNRVEMMGVSGSGIKNNIKLEDTNTIQKIVLPNEIISDSLIMKIISVYKGEKYNDTCLTLISFDFKPEYLGMYRSDKLSSNDNFSIIITPDNVDTIKYKNYPPDVLASWFVYLIKNNELNYVVNKMVGTYELQIIDMWNRYYKNKIVQIGIPKQFGMTEYKDNAGDYYHLCYIWLYVRINDNGIISEYIFPASVREEGGVWKVNQIDDMFFEYEWYKKKFN